MRRFGLAILAAAMLVAGCFPVLLDVDSRGRVLIPRGEGLFLLETKAGKVQMLTRATAGAPAWARWSADGNLVLLCSTDEGKQSELSVINVKSKQAKSYGTFSAAACALWSPDGKAITVAQRKGDNEHCLVLVNLVTGERKAVLDRALPMHVWLSGSVILAFRIDRFQAESGICQGNLVAIDLAGGAQKVIAPATCNTLSTLDVDAGRKKVLVTEIGGGTFSLVAVSLDDGTKTTLVPREVFSAFWSPDGQRIAICRPVGIQGNTTHARFSVARRGPQFELAVTDAAGAHAVVVAGDVISRTELTSEGRPVFPTWIDNEHLLYFQQASAYGPAGGAMHLASVKIDGTERTDLQTTIDAGVSDALRGRN